MAGMDTSRSSETVPNQIILKRMVLGELDTNCYLASRRDRTDWVVIDPADHAEAIQAELESVGGVLGAILLTHGHFDHIGAAEALRSVYGCEIYAGMQEKQLLQDANKNLSAVYGSPISIGADKYAEDHDKLEICGMTLEVLSTPGHTAGSVCYYLPEAGVLFAGDTLFNRSAGRTDLPTGSMQQLLLSIENQLTCLPDETMVLSGHGSATTIGLEKLNNPYMKR